MGTPEDVAAEKYFTPPTLTEALRKNLYMEPENDIQARAIEDTLNIIRSTFKEWLRTVELPNETLEALRSQRQLLIILVDEPDGTKVEEG